MPLLSLLYGCWCKITLLLWADFFTLCHAFVSLEGTHVTKRYKQVAMPVKVAKWGFNYYYYYSPYITLASNAPSRLPCSFVKQKKDFTFSRKDKDDNVALAVVLAQSPQLPLPPPPYLLQIPTTTLVIISHNCKKPFKQLAHQ